MDQYLKKLIKKFINLKENKIRMKSNYLVFIDVELFGFVVDIYEDNHTAKIIMNMIWELGNPPTPGQEGITSISTV
jgi:hypothetical protein